MSLDEFTDDANKAKGSSKFPTPPPPPPPPHNVFLDDYVQEQLKQIQKHLDDQFIAQTVATLSAILKDPKHPAHHTVRQLVLEAKNAATKP